MTIDNAFEAECGVRSKEKDFLAVERVVKPGRTLTVILPKKLSVAL